MPNGEKEKLFFPWRAPRAHCEGTNLQSKEDDTLVKRCVVVQYLLGHFQMVSFLRATPRAWIIGVLAGIR